MIKKIFWFAGLLFLCSCGFNRENGDSLLVSQENVSKNEPVYRRISAEEAHDIMKSADFYILLDVRTPEEHNEIKIPGSILIPESEINERAPVELPDKNALILVHCRSGARSEKASRALVEMGYTNIYDFGGIIDWPFETE